MLKNHPSFLPLSMRSFYHINMFLAISLLSQFAGAQTQSTAIGSVKDAQDLYFRHKDWELACDNTRTCRAAGYSAEASLGSVASILLSRIAGASTPIAIVFKALNDADGNEAKGKFNLQLGTTKHGAFTFGANLSEVQAKTLLPGLLSGQKIELMQGGKRWRISLAGINAMALKMDEVQKRIGTPNALTASSRVTNDESNVAQPLPIPTIKIPKLPPQNGINEVVIQSIKNALPKFDCSAKTESISVIQLNDKKALVEVSPCERAAYNEENAYFITNIKAPHSPEQLNFDNPVNEYSLGVITGFYKGRGIGDCVSAAEYVWDGARFLKANASGSGMCRGFLGGAWDMPTVINKVDNPNLVRQKKKFK
jgi:Protein of unknown function (DUF1176)